MARTVAAARPQLSVATSNVAAQFKAASSQYLLIADNASLSMGDIGMMGAAWVYRDSDTAQTMVIAGKYSGTVATSEWLVFRNSGTNRYQLSADGGSTETNVSADTFGATSTRVFDFLAWFHDPVNDLIGISVNGGAYDTAAHSVGLNDGTAPFQIGARDNGGSPLRFWDGRIGPVVVCKSPPLGVAALKNQFRDRLYNAGRALTYADLNSVEKTAMGLVSFWNLNEASGNRADSHGANTLTDNATVTSNPGNVAIARTSATTRSAAVSRAAA